MSRRLCERCCRPEIACLCQWISPQENVLPVLILQHPDETKHAIGTAKLIVAGLYTARLETALVFPHAEIQSWLSDWSVSRPLLIYPKPLRPDAAHFTLDFETEHFSASALHNQFDCLILLDGTWRNTRELLLQNSWLQSLPTLALKHAGESRYRIRQAAQKGALSTIEAVSEVLRVFDARFDTERLLRPFVKMIDYQISRMGADVYQRNYSSPAVESSGKNDTPE